MRGKDKVVDFIAKFGGEAEEGEVARLLSDFPLYGAFPARVRGWHYC